ncbi:MAG: hypothetical protein BWY04_01363 [candidate division CPR1 bacterium ADurb.Bin160]|uniref:Uncharacterized protein n=1 Tax=candidate division CPR1 bacterium ADurb.Bin160 TaxID=1852826 RepID=A0A1V5ZJR2_9BACT|nr:MAG: hypothetical protein BWY04_01363 [candidate division CPR1 bacterium ADurb.Bin160]
MEKNCDCGTCGCEKLENLDRIIQTGQSFKINLSSELVEDLSIILSQYLNQLKMYEEMIINEATDQVEKQIEKIPTSKTKIQKINDLISDMVSHKNRIENFLETIEKFKCGEENDNK